MKYYCVVCINLCITVPTNVSQTFQTIIHNDKFELPGGKKRNTACFQAYGGICACVMLVPHGNLGAASSTELGFVLHCTKYAVFSECYLFHICLGSSLT